MSTPAVSGCVLLVDDDPDILYTVKLFLELDGHRVLTAGRVNEALVTLDQEPIDVVVTDLVLPGLTGLDLLTALRHGREDVEVVLVTGHADVSSATDALRQRAFDYLHKPVTGTAIRATVRRAVAARRSRDAERRHVEDQQTRMSALAGAVRDRTAELAVSQERYRHLVESLPIAILEIDTAAGKITYSGGALLASLLERFGGTFPVPWSSGIHPDDRPRVEEVVARLLAGEPLSEPWELRAGLESRGYADLRAVSVRSESEGRIACVMFDVTKEREVERERLRLERELEAARTQLETNLLGALDLQVGVAAHSVARGPADVPARVGDAVFGVSTAMHAVEELALLAAEHTQPVLILGETGTGKGVVARFIHDRSGRGPFVSLNCSSLRGELFDSELFGHVRGAFTSAVKDRRGLVEEASGGTLFLDEIGETTPESQARLLKLLEERTFRRVGETKERTSDFRLVCATNRDLPSEAESGRFRRDLLYRINLFTIDLPPLRDRPGDVSWLVRRLLASLGAIDVPVLPQTMELLERYAFPGNVRELRNAIIRATLLARGRALAPEHFLEIARSVPPARPSDAPAPARPNLSMGSASGTKLQLAPDERAEIVELLERFDGNRAKVARALGVSRTTLYKRLHAYGLSTED